MSEETRTYEFSYLVSPIVTESEIESVIDGLKKEIETAEGTIVAEGKPEFIDLAYTIEKVVASKKQKWSQGYFGWVKFTAEPAVMEVLKKAFDANTTIIRYMLIKTSAENLITFKKPKNEARRFDSATDDAIFENLEEDEDTAEVLEVHETLPNLSAEVLEDSADKTEA